MKLPDQNRRIVVFTLEFNFDFVTLFVFRLNPLCVTSTHHNSGTMYRLSGSVYIGSNRIAIPFIKIDFDFAQVWPKKIRVPHRNIYKALIVMCDTKFYKNCHFLIID